MERIGREQLLKLQKKYSTDKAIADIYGVTRQAIYKLRKKYDIPAIDSPQKERNQKIRELAQSGIRPERIAVRFELSVTQVYRILHNRKIRMINIEKLVYRSAAELATLLAPFREEGKRIVTTNGCFDILHAGHLQYLKEASAEGDILIVGINSDASVKRLKGEDRPIQNEEDRATLMAALKPVSFSLIFEEDTPCEFLEIIKPDVHVKGGDYTPTDLPEAKVVWDHGGEVKVLSFKDGRSTTKIVEKMRG